MPPKKQDMKNFLPMRRIKKIHFIGIGGSGMSGIAEVLLTQGYKISGSDQNSSAVTERLRKLGAKIFNKHAQKNIHEADVIVISSAITENNPELIAAKVAHIPIIPRAQMLAELMRFNYGIAIAGTHGKTTTTSLIASVFAEAGLDPTFVIGGLLNSAGTHARLGASNYFIVEADESDASFLHFNPMISVVTNIDADHMATYNNNFEELKHAFIDFTHNLPFYGLAVVCVDSQTVCEILPQISRPIITYGFSKNADIRASNYKQNKFACSFKVEHKFLKKTFDVNLNLAGQHNVLNALAAISVACECKIKISSIKKALAQFGGVGRRMQQHGELSFPAGNVLVIEDYGHHPEEIKVTIKALRSALPKRRLVVAFQPHRYSRTQDLFDDFVSALEEVDALLLMEIYAASEKPIAGIDSKTLARSIRQRGKIDPIVVANNEELLKILPTTLRDNDILLIQGAGNIGSVAKLLTSTKIHNF